MSQMFRFLLLSLLIPIYKSLWTVHNRFLKQKEFVHSWLQTNFLLL